MDATIKVKPISTLQIQIFIAFPGECFGVCFVEVEIIADFVRGGDLVYGVLVRRDVLPLW